MTGAAGGQGEMEAKMIAQQGAKVYMADIEEEGLKRVEAAIIARRRRSRGVSDGRCRRRLLQELVKKVVDESGRLDVLVNNAGMCQNGTVLTETRESLNRIMDVDCWGRVQRHALLRTRHHRSGRRHHRQHVLLPRHRPFGPGSFTATPWPRPRHGHDARRRTDLGTYGIRVNAVNPGLVLSGMTLPRGQNRKGLVDASSMKRYALPEEIASVVMFLASDDSSFINGEFIAADGGATTYLHLATADAK